MSNFEPEKKEMTNKNSCDETDTSLKATKSMLASGFQKHIIVYVLTFFFSLTFCYSQSVNDRDDSHNLLFAMREGTVLKRWSVNPILSSGILKTDSTEQMNGKYPLVIENEHFFGHTPVRIILQQKLLLPGFLSETAEISIVYKSRNIKQLNFTISGLDKYENRLYSDTLFLSEKKEWKSTTIRVPLRNVAFLCLFK